MPVDLSGKRIIVTGGATGIGRAVAIRTAVYGAKVAVFDMNDGDGQDTVNDIAESGGDARYWHVDVRDGEAVSKVVGAAGAWLGGIDVLVHLAGVLHGASVELDEFPEATWDTVVDINLRGSFLMAKHVSAVMKAQKRGTIILASSGAGVLGGSSSFAYGSSKGGVHGLTLVMQNSLEKYGIRVNDILPGAVRTPLKVAQVKTTYDLTGDKETFDRTMDSLASPDDVAKVIAFMASDEANVLRGSVRTA
ncbi:MAG: SDR family NAD(P)-dependent oxidoreductase [Chloroflexi bacterium]|nr:SDR family NAD(P)-dependent oxidoreductase [Chloroflexota bacterium]MDA1297137.1 SDR family NAD(P)-dependent oxidoreductase [Chloroflexota bacterium]